MAFFSIGFDPTFALEPWGATTPVTELAAPTGLAFTPTSATTAGVSWNQVANNSGYTVQRATNAGFTTGLQTVQVATDATSYAFTGLTASTHYWARVLTKGTGSYANSVYSAADDDTTLAGIPGARMQPGVAGDSLDKGNDLSESQAYPALLQSGLGTVDYGPFANFAQNGEPLSDALGGANSVLGRLTGILATRDTTTYPQALLIIGGGYNDARLEVSSGATDLDAIATRLYAKTKAAHDQAHAAGWKTMALTHAWNDFVGSTSLTSTQLTLLKNSLIEVDKRIRAGWVADFHAEVFVDLGLSDRMGLTTHDASLYEADQVHPNAAGHIYKASIIRPAVEAAHAGTPYGAVTPYPGAGAPTIASFSPTGGLAGTSVTLTGTNYTGVTSVKFNGLTASFSIVSATSLVAVVPTGSAAGTITVTNPAGTGSSTTPFSVRPYATAGIVEQDSPAIDYTPAFTGTGRWAENSGYPGPYGTDGIARLLANDGVAGEVSLYFTGTQAAWYSYINGLNADVLVSVDGGAETLVVAPASAGTPQAVYTTPVLTAGNHSLRIRRAVSSEGFVTNCYFVVS